MFKYQKNLIFWNILLFYLVFLSLLFSQSGNTPENLNISEIELLDKNEIKFNKSTLKIINNTKYYEAHTWIFNNRVFQYSAHLFIKNGRLIEIDGMIMTEETDETFGQGTFTCIIKSKNTDKEFHFNATKILSFTFSNTKRVKCYIKEKFQIDFDDIVVAIINKLDFNDKEDNLDKIESGKIFFQLPHNMINFQKPRLIHIPVVKKPKIAHCLHYTYNYLEIGIDKILKWLEYQKSVGIDKIILYNSDRHNILENAVYSKYNESFIEIRPYFINYDIICDFYRLKTLKEKNIVKYQVLKDYCEELFYTRFDDPSYNSSNRWKHQKVSCNDCYTSFEHVYEFVSYYDFDEIIYPRKASLNAYSSLVGDEETSCEQSNICRLVSNYKNDFNLYEYSMDLINRTYTSRKPFLSLYFTNAFYLEENYYVKKLLFDLNKVLKTFKNIFDSNSSKNITLLLKFNRYMGHNFIIRYNDYEHIKQLCDIYKYISCLQSDESRSSKKRFLYFITEKEHQMGKLIHFTDNVFGLHTHYPHVHVKNGEKLNVDSNEAILMHFRSDMFSKANNRYSSILNLKIDFEYYLHFMSKYTNACSNYFI
jgi:hypothetical protein